ncbi:MAG: quinone-dependent dihydroorotate dehydrogenase [Pseudanabaenaceae cyanobacterium SKYGB_i_bin29]|nr:quinone-dependent dihydroorotate dehydrogenase [Pseudanabaenaceae cyanobacterium SKYG29]MDW8421438.1 quinone-dependent dihydroorotate dehydrogenase [Pseudanabaenaceae cyanobacterium SKYGB_i_bin29]
MYQSFLRPLLFTIDPEQAHQLTITIGRSICRSQFWRDRLAAWFAYDHPCLQQEVMGIKFRNPLGLAAGFDKNAELLSLWEAIGFGFAEVGTITPLPQAGNPRPRLFRLPEDEGILNRMGFNNAGAFAISERIGKVNFPVGINLGKQKETPIEGAAQDYLTSFSLLKDKGDYFVINVSSPNTPNLRDLQAVKHLDCILTTLMAANTNGKPLLVKIAPDLADTDILGIVDLCLARGVSGIIATNTTTARDNLRQQKYIYEPGGISGAPLRSRSTAVIRLIYRYSQGKLPIIGVGGISSAEDAWEKLRAGASLLQVYTGLVYRGPGLIREILQGITHRMVRHHFTDLRAVIGSRIEGDKE